MEIYIHIPFCVQKCSYCDFNSHAARPQEQEQYVNALLKEIRAWGKVTKEKIETIFIGGGTPTCISVKLMRSILRELRMSFFIEKDAEISMECNPGTVTKESLQAYHDMGINRLSIGMQSAQDDELALLGRIHDSREFLETYQNARDCGFDNINIDIMTGLPFQTWKKLKNTLEIAAALHPEHISCYSLIIEPGTPFFDRYQKDCERREKGLSTEVLPDSDTEYLLYANARSYLESRGYHQYEVSNYAKEGYACRHNIGYWQRIPYIGIGVSAAGLIKDPDNLREYGNLRYTNITDTKEYMKIAESFGGGIPDLSEGISPFADPGTVEYQSAEDSMEEFMFLGLRMNEGVKTAEFYRMFGRTMSNVYGNVIEKHIKNGLMKQTREGYALTETGMDISNEVLADFLL